MFDFISGSYHNEIMKFCPKCLVKKRLTEFYKRKRGPRAGEYYEKCKDCMKARGRNYYHLNRERQLKLALTRRHKYREDCKEFLRKLKNRPCQDCGKRYPTCVMDFDHRAGEIKLREVATMVARGWSLKKIIKEIKKCDIVCANCHRLRTHAGIAKVVTAGL